VQTEFGGVNPIYFSEYYKNGPTGYVTSTIGSEPGAWGSWTTSTHYTYNMHNILNIGVNYWVINENGSAVSGAEYDDYLQLDSNNMVVVGSYQYERAQSHYSYYIPSKGNADSYYSYHYRKRAASTQITVNVNIPTADEISMSNMYEGRKT
jgi:hypothetical protein